MSLETEAKLTVSDLVTFNRVKSLRALAGFSLALGGKRSVRDVYQDTPHRALLAAGWALRLRWTEGQILVTAKSTAKAPGGVHEREELETRLPSPLPALEWPESELRTLVLGAQGSEQLADLFEVCQERLVREVWRADRLVAEMSLDRVRVLAGGREKEYRELEIELRPAGSREELLSIVSALQNDLTLSPSPRSKFEEGLLLLDGNDPLSTPPLSPRKTHRRPAGPARKALLLVAPEGTTAEAVCAELSRLGYRFHARLRKEERRLYFDTQAGSLFKQRVELYFESRQSRWHYLRDGLEVHAQKGVAEHPPVAGPAALAIKEITGTTPAIAYLEAAEQETVLSVASLSGPNVGLSLRVWQLGSPLHEALPRTALTLAFDRDAPAAFAVDYVARLLREALGLTEQKVTDLETGLSRLGVPFPGAPLPSSFLPAKGDDAAAACAKVLAGEAWRMNANTPGAARNLDAEFVHDLRVATRRARFACRLFAGVLGAGRSEKVRLELSWIAGLLGGVRDLDVLTARVDSQLGRVEADDAFQGIIARVLQDRRARARELLVPALLSERYAALLALMSAPAGGRGGGESAESFARRRIGRALAKIAQWTRQDPEKLTAEQMHRLRILFKRLRYTVEFFRSILGQGAALLARECVAYQDCLGLHQDARVAAGVLARLADEPVVREQKDGLLTLGALVQVQREMMRLQRERFRTLWGTVESLFDLWNAPPAKVRP